MKRPGTAIPSASLCALVVAGCCGDLSNYVIEFAAQREGIGVYSGLVWNGYTSSPYGDPEFIRVFIPEGNGVEREVVEFFDGDMPLEIAGTRRSDVAPEGACAGDAIDYDLSGLPSGTYTMVHRRSAAPGGLTTTDGPWTTFQGEPALVTMLVLTSP